uniref:TF-B3 domain-containing protein n=1 Tax=Aegilops tauschii subsp. strangulata TaxID=200361 RepID=A0A453JTC6_AEGTS
MCNEQNQYIEQGYADCHLPREDQIMRLRLPGKNDTWKAKLYVGDKVNGKFNALRRGWKKLVKDNKLQEGDMCLFELLKKRGGAHHECPHN